MEMIVAGAIILLSIFPGSAQEKIQKSITPVPSPSLAPKTTAIKISPAPKPTETPKKPTIHIVEAGETMDSIAKDYYGASKFWTTIWNDNETIEDPRVIHSGMELKIRDEKPEKVEKLNEKLQTAYDELINPSPTPTPTGAPIPTGEVKGVSVSQPQAGPSNFDDAYRQAGTRFGVPWEILYGIHHMETGGRDGAISSGYGTGAQGPLQFMPGTWASYGIDGNGDGTADINNAIDAIFGAANFIAAHGGVEPGLKSYGGNSELVYSYARSRGWNQ